MTWSLGSGQKATPSLADLRAKAGRCSHPWSPPAPIPGASQTRKVSVDAASVELSSVLR